MVLHKTILPKCQTFGSVVCFFQLTISDCFWSGIMPSDRPLRFGLHSVLTIARHDLCQPINPKIAQPRSGHSVWLLNGSELSWKLWEKENGEGTEWSFASRSIKGFPLSFNGSLIQLICVYRHHQPNARRREMPISWAASPYWIISYSMILSVFDSVLK